MVYTQSGLPIYSKCYGNFCKSAFESPEMLAGLLSAIETIPPTLSEGLSLQSISMGPTTMRFSKVMPDGHSVVIGLSDENPEVAEAVFNAVERILTLDKFKSFDWSYVTSEIVEEFTSELVHGYLIDAMKNYGGFSDTCPMGDKCLLHTDALTSRRTRIWDAIKSKYDKAREMMRRKK